MCSRHKSLRWASVMVLGAMLLTLGSAYANTYTVTNTNDAGTGSLRQAITNANNHSGPDTIVFSVSGTIYPNSALPALTDDSTLIDASSQWSGEWPGGGAPGVTINGDSTGSDTTNGLETNGADYCVIRGLLIRSFSGSGVYINGNDHNTIGGTGTGERNVISGNGGHGVYIDDAAANENVVKGNYIGTNAAGTGSLGNINNGVYIDGPSNNTIGGSTSGEGNVISGNGEYGVHIDHSATGNVVRGNYIGTDAVGTGDLGNTNHGIYIDGGASSNTIGGTGSGQGNIIAFNGGDGIALGHSDADENEISGNSIYHNTGLGIDLDNDGVTGNDNQYNGSLANNGIDYPIIDTARLSGDTLHVAGFIGTNRTGTAFSNCRVDFFIPNPDPTGYGEGRYYLGYLTTGSQSFSGNLDVTGMGVSVGDLISGVTIDTNGNTSEFGSDSVIVSPTSIVISSFTAEAENGLVIVLWKTESEVNTAGFNLYRSPKEDGEYLKLNGSLIPSRGDQITGASYEFVDGAGKRGDFYKLEVVELSGSSTFYGPVEAKVTGVEEVKMQNEKCKIEVVPNPFKQMTEVRYQIPARTYVSLRVYDATGKLVRTLIDEPQDAGYYRIRWDGKIFSNGVYFFLLNTPGGRAKIERAIRVK